jgi:hypothetical protein
MSASPSRALPSAFYSPKPKPKTIHSSPPMTTTDWSLEIYLEIMGRSKVDLEELIHTRVQLTTVSPKWVVAFIEHKGTDGIVRVLSYIDKKKKKTATDLTKQLECVRCFAALMNTKVSA